MISVPDRASAVVASSEIPRCPVVALGNRAEANTPAVVFDALRLGIRACAKDPAVIFDALRSGYVHLQILPQTEAVQDHFVLFPYPW